MKATDHLKLGVNVDHVATLRQARGTSYPSPREAAERCVAAGAEGITLHLREDRRHIQDADLREIREAVTDVPLNLEMANVPEIVAIALDIQPDEVCLVPERRAELTTEGGLDADGQADALGESIERLSEAGITVSLFIEADARQIDAAVSLGAPCIELHTGTFCDRAGDERRQELERLRRGAESAHAAGLQVNAGHGLTVTNVPELFSVPHLDTLNIGHSIIARAVMVGLDRAVREMIEVMAEYPSGGERGP